ncbi:MAG: prenyltransferase/squalene oxidase repeat-containing protein [Planctomycetaceae bacterium]
MHVDDLARLHDAAKLATQTLLNARGGEHYWTGELSTSALSTATAVMALEQVRRGGVDWIDANQFQRLIDGGTRWLREHQNADGGWGDTVKSLSNISTTMLCHATLTATAETASPSQDKILAETTTSSIDLAKSFIDAAGGVPAVIKRYGKDKTFSIPILTHCALAGLVEWETITQLPFELACLPAKFYKTVRLPVVSYALPALIAIGQVRHHFCPTWNPLTRIIRNRSIAKSLQVLERIQPTNGGFLEAAPLTSFVTMALAAKGLAAHPVVRKGVAFLVDSVRPDGSWPIDTNLSTWVTTLSINALGVDLPEESREPLRKWLLDQQYHEVHPFTNADPGGWSWTPLPGGVPDADDTPGAMLALAEIAAVSPQQGGDVLADCVVSHRNAVSTNYTVDIQTETPDRLAIQRGTDWLLSLQNRDGGFPTFCRGWGKLPFDRSSPDITAHCLRGMLRSKHVNGVPLVLADQDSSVRWRFVSNETRMRLTDESRWLNEPWGKAVHRGFQFLRRLQRGDGSWLPLWFGNQFAPDDISPTYGTAKVLALYRDAGLLESATAQRGLTWLRGNQNQDGGWGAGPGTQSSVEETALATELLLEDPSARNHVDRGLLWLIARVEAGTIDEPAPIGFYFAKLWYFERLYPLIFAVACLRRASKKLDEAEVAEDH